MKTATPETDAQLNRIIIENEDSWREIYVKMDGEAYQGGLVSADFARKLEAERDAAREECDAIKVAVLRLAKLDFGSRGWDAECESAALQLRACISTP